MSGMTIMGVALCIVSGFFGPDEWRSRLAVLAGIVGGVLVGASPL